MSTIEFDEPSGITNYRQIDISKAVTHNTPLLIKYGIVKDLRMANIVMIVSLIAFAIGTIVIFSARPSSDVKIYKEDYSPSELQHMHPEAVKRLPTKQP